MRVRQRLNPETNHPFNKVVFALEAEGGWCQFVWQPLSSAERERFDDCLPKEW